MLVLGAWSQNRGRLALTVVAIALGVALATAVHLINYSAAAEFESALRALWGDANVHVSGPRSGFKEDLYPLVARRDEVAVASPIVEIEAKVAHPVDRLRIVGIDPFRALMLQPGLLGDAVDQLRELLRPNTVMLSHAAAQKLGLSTGDSLELQVGLRRVHLTVVATLPLTDALRQPFALMDIASAQWAFDHLGQLSRIELRLRPGASTRAVLEQLNRDLPPGVVALESNQATDQGLALSRAYRVNLNMLALVSLFTGGVLVFSTQTLSTLRRRTHLALLRALGVTRKTICTVLATEAVAFGCLGTLVGLLLGVLVADLAIAHFGSDLGAGYFAGVVARTWIDVRGLLTIALCGLGASLLGGLLPALEAGRAEPAAALHAGDEQMIFERIPRLLPGFALLAGGAVLSLLPAVDGLPVFGYGAIACLLVGALFLMPAYVQWALRAIPRPRWASAWLALRQLRGAPGYAGISLAAILASFSLAVAMLVMIQSFRGSLETWLEGVLPADLYARAGRVSSAWIDAAAQARLAAAPSVERIVFSRYDTLQFANGRPEVTLIARDMPAGQPEALQLVAPPRPPAPGTTPAWISEAMRDLYDLRVGQRLQLPLAGNAIETTVSGVFRDYARHSGTVVIPRSVYVSSTGERRVNEAWIWLRPGFDPQGSTAALRAALGVGSEMEFREPGLLRELSLATFDRTFAVTYALQVAAVVIGLFGISVGASSQAIARRREFGMLRHLGMSRRHLCFTLAVEGGVVGALGAIAGLLVGGATSLVLIHVINRQSFHWSMELHVPWLCLLALCVLLAGCAALTAGLSVRGALGQDIVRAVKEDW